MHLVLRKLTRSGTELPAGIVQAVNAAADLGLPLRAELDLPPDAFHLRTERARYDQADTILILADPALTRCALRWREAASTSIRSLEYVFPAEPAPAITALRRRAEAAPKRNRARCTLDPRVETQIVEMLTAGGCTAMARIPEWLREDDGPDRARQTWQTVESSSFLIPWEPDGAQVDNVLGTLEEALLHVFDRFREVLNDHRLDPAKRRPEFLRDLRTIIRAAETGADRDPGLYARRLLLQRNLHISHSCSGEAVLPWIARATGRERVFSCLDANLHPAEAVPDRDEDTPGPDTALLWAWSAARRSRLAGEDGNDFAQAAARIDARRTLLGRPWLHHARGGKTRLERSLPETVGLVVLLPTAAGK